MFDEFDTVGKGRDNPLERGELRRVVNTLSIGSYSSDKYDDRGEVSGYAKVAIVELRFETRKKRGISSDLLH